MTAPFAKLVVAGRDYASAGKGGEGGDPDALQIGPCTSSLLALVAAFHGMTPAQWLEYEIARECERIGLPALADIERGNR